MASILGALIGAAIDRRDGHRGIRGALIGAAVQSGLRVAVPLGQALLIGSALKRRWEGKRRNADPTFPPEASPNSR